MDLLLEFKSRGMELVPKLAIEDGALGFWDALRKVCVHSRPHRCWVRKTANVFRTPRKSLLPQAKRRLHDSWTAEGREGLLAPARN